MKYQPDKFSDSVLKHHDGIGNMPNKFSSISNIEKLNNILKFFVPFRKNGSFYFVNKNIM